MAGPDHYSNGDVPVFRPSMDEFSDFERYMKSINQYGMQSGIVKVIPPKEWVESLPAVTNKQLMSIKIRNPIVQHISGNNGVFGQQNVEKQRTFNIVQWKSLSEEVNNQPPAPRGKMRHTADAATAKKNKKILANKNHNDESLFENFEYNIDTSEFTEERCEQLEKVYWKSLLYADPLYGADMLGSIFDDTVKVWNVSHLPNVLDHMDQKLPGVNEAYLYAGLWKATFSWHLEDQDLYSINYIHFGAPKQWYSIPQAYKEKFDRVMQETFPQEYENCHDFLRHKTFLVSPAFLEARGVKVNRVVHYEHEFMITYPYGYHAGMNFGYNLAESVNFAIDDWFEYGLKTTKCLCIQDAVGINVPRLIRRFKGEPEPEPEKEQEPTQNSENISDHEVSNKDNSEIEVSQVEKPRPLKKRKVEDKKPKIEKPKIEKLKAEKPKVLPLKCCLCPNVLSSRQQKYESFRLLPSLETTEDRAKKIYCHKICAKTTPELIIVHDIDIGEYVENIDQIPKARKNLKCVYCHEKNGSCFQCSYGNCTRAFHGTCALPAGVFFKGENEHYCKVHRSNYDKNETYSKTLSVGDTIQAKFDEYFSGVVVAHNRSEHSYTIELYPIPEKVSEKVEVEVPYSSITTQDLRFPKSSKKAKPVVIDVSSDENEIVVLNLDDKLRYSAEVEEFDGRKWILEKVKVIETGDGSPSDHPLWYYKPDKSTDHIARYVDDISLNEPNDPNSLKKKQRQEAKANRLARKKSGSPAKSTSPITSAAPTLDGTNLNYSYSSSPSFVPDHFVKTINQAPNIASSTQPHKYVAIQPNYHQT